MPLPSSGQISMGDINVELGRGRTTANTSLAGGTTPTAGSLFGLANNTVNKTAPHQISEFYGYNNTPNSTLYAQVTNDDPYWYAYARVFYNSTSISIFSAGSSNTGTINLSPTSQTITADAYHSNNGFCDAYWTLNGVFQGSDSNSGFAEIQVSTTPGNAYEVFAYAGFVDSGGGI